MNKVAGCLEVGCNENGEVVINHPNLDRNAAGVGHIVFSPKQARHLAYLLLKHAADSDVRSGVTMLIHEVADEVGVHAETIRRLEKKGEVFSRRDANGWRRYDRAEVERLKKYYATNRPEDEE